MVNHNSTMTNLEPANLEENLSSVEFDMPAAETDTDDDDDMQNAYNGYEPLPTGPEDYQPSYQLNMEADEPNENQENQQIQSTDDTSKNSTTIETELLWEVWNQPSTSTDIQMDANKINEVKRAMLNFTLPVGNIPEWAKNIPEDQWKDNLLHKISTKKT